MKNTAKTAIMIFAANCAACHNRKLNVARLNLGSFDEALKMPPGGKLKDEELADLRTGIQAGATWPGAVQTADAAPRPKNSREFTETGKKFWVFQKPADQLTLHKRRTYRYSGRDSRLTGVAGVVAEKVWA